MMLVNISALFILNPSVNTNNKKTMHIVFENIKSVNITLYEIPYDHEYIKHIFHFINLTENEVAIQYISFAGEKLDTVIQFDCSCTLDGSNFCKIKSIEYAI